MNTLAWMCIVLGVMLFIQTLRQFRGARALSKLQVKSANIIAELHRRDQVQAYHALEKGMDEQQESYEQEYLTWDEKKEELLEVIHEKNLQINQWVDDVRLLLGIVYDFEEVTLMGPVTRKQVEEIHDRQRVA